MSFMLPNQQRQSTEGNTDIKNSYSMRICLLLHGKQQTAMNDE